MKTALVTITGVSAYGQGKFADIPRLKNPNGVVIETSEDHELRTWRERLHYDPATEEVYIPPMAFKNALSEAAKFVSMQVPGKGKSTYTKHFEAGVLCFKPLMLGIKKNEVQSETLFVPSDGKRGGGTRVKKIFPVIQKWGGVVEFTILDDTITKDVFKTHIEVAGNLIGIGRFRPRNNGYYGRFAVTNIEWIEG